MKDDLFSLVIGIVVCLAFMILGQYHVELFELIAISVGFLIAWTVKLTLDIGDDLRKIKRGQLLHKDKLVQFSNRVPDEHKRILIYANVEHYMCWTFTVTRRGDRYYRDLDDLEIKIPLHHYWIYLEDL